jgi:hypothetical protein
MGRFRRAARSHFLMRRGLQRGDSDGCSYQKHNLLEVRVADALPEGAQTIRLNRTARGILVNDRLLLGLMGQDVSHPQRFALCRIEAPFERKENVSHVAAVRRHEGGAAELRLGTVDGGGVAAVGAHE